MTVANFTSSTRSHARRLRRAQRMMALRGVNSICNRRRRTLPRYPSTKTKWIRRTPGVPHVVVRDGNRARNFKEKHFHCHTPGRSVARRFYATPQRQMLGVVTTDGRRVGFTRLAVTSALRGLSRRWLTARSFHPRVRARKSVEARTGSTDSFFVRS